MRQSMASNYDVVIVGASIAGCTTATLLGRRGLRVALVERRPNPQAFKRVCGHFIQSSAVPMLERHGLLAPIERAGAVRSRTRAWTRWGWVEPPAHSTLPASLNLRREKLDPLLRSIAAETPGVTMLLGATVDRLLLDEERIVGVETRDVHGDRQRLSAPLVVGADGRESPVAALAGLTSRVRPHGRFVYAGYFEGPPPGGAPHGSVWFLDPQWAAAFPTDAGLTLYTCMLTEERRPDFRRDPAQALRAFLADLPDPPPIAASRMVGPVTGKLQMPNVRRGPVGPGIALVGDAAVTSDPVAGVGCGWAFQAAEWLADATAPALHGSEPLATGLRRYRQRLRRELHAHDNMITGYATGRPMHPIERQVFSTAARDRRLAPAFEALATRTTDPRRVLPALAPQIVSSHVRRTLARRAGRPQLEVSA